MNNARFWTGLVFLGGLPMGLALGSARESAPIQTALEGRVRFNGQPVTRGVVYFYSSDWRRSSDVIASLRPDGSFSCRHFWQVDDENRVRFRVHVYPDPRHPEAKASGQKPSPAPIPARTSPADPRIAQLMDATRGVPGPAPAFMSPAALTPPASPSSIRDGFDVTLGPEPTFVAIDLKD